MTTKYTDRVCQQVPMPVESHQKLKNYASESGMTMNEVYDSMLLWFLGEKKNNANFHYLASPKGTSKYITMWIDDNIIAMVKKLSKQDSMSINRIIFTAITYFLQEKE